MPRCLLLVALCAAGLAAGGCDSSVDPFLGTELPYTLWGVFNPKADTQAVRVFVIDERLRLVQPDPLDAAVTSERVGDASATVWRDSVVTLADGDFRHVFWAPMEVRHGETYRLRVRRSDGVTSTAEVTVPPPVELQVLPPNLSGFREILLPILVAGSPPSLPRVDVTYFAETVPDEAAPRAIENPVTVSYSGTGRPHPEGWLLEVDLRRDFATVRQDFFDRELPFQNIALQGIEMRVHVGDERWTSPAGVFVADVLVEPGTLSNVENGFGFVGAGYVEAITWRPPVELVQRAGFSGLGS